MLKERMKAEADTRIRILEELGMWESVGEAWNKGQVCFSKTAAVSVLAKEELVGVIFTFDEGCRLNVIKVEFEKRTGCLVYYGMYTKTQVGNVLSLLYVGTDENEWEEERNALIKGMPVAYCYNLVTEQEGIVNIHTKMARGGLVRIT